MMNTVRPDINQLKERIKEDFAGELAGTLCVARPVVGDALGGVRRVELVHEAAIHAVVHERVPASLEHVRARVSR